MTAPNVPPVPSEVTEDLATKLVTEHLADGKIVTEPEATYLAEQVAEGHAHDTNEARVEIGLAQIPTLPASPDGAGNPTFVVAASGYTQVAGEEQAALVSVPNVAIPPAPAPSAPPVHHANWLHSILVALEAAGALVSSPAVVAMLPPKYQGYAVAIGAVDGLVAGGRSQAPPG